MFSPGQQPAPKPLPAPVKVSLLVTGEHDCPYLPDRVAMNRAFLVRRMDPEIYHDFMDAGFRRSGTLVYQPACRTCSACRPIRVPVERFQPTKSQRRAWRRNQDLTISIDPPAPTPEKFELYARYVRDRHHGDDPTWDGFVEFLYTSPVKTIEFTYRDESGRLLAVGLCDVCARSLSSVYFYFDPREAKRGLGTFGALEEIAFARERGIPHYYLGFWIEGCRTMDYKATFRPHQVLGADGVWRDVSENERCP